MHGSLRIAKSRLTPVTRELYRGHYCGSCHALREFGGRLSSVLTSYDQTVLALVLGGLEDAGAAFRPCTINPLRSVPVTELSAASRAYVAALGIALAEAKLIDDVMDGDGRILRRAALRLLRGRARRATDTLNDLGFPVAEIASIMPRQAAAEALPSPTLEALAEPSARLTGAIFAFAGTLTTRATPELEEFGRALGRFVYAWDAFVDRDDDRRRGRFNALDAAFGSSAAVGATRMFLRRQLATLRRCLPTLELGARGELVIHLLDSLEQKTDHSLPPKSAEAGDCDCACDCGGCDGCDACSGGEGAGCCSGGDGAGLGSGCPCDACTACDVCGWDRRKSKKQKFSAPDPIVRQE